MASQPLIQSPLFKFVLLLCCGRFLCQQDCTGVDCPRLKHCIEEVLEQGGCCATCLQTGCMCEGYQYYDCVRAGFRNGKVPEGKSYFVDFGSTECSCPQGGGRITCHFIPCPDVPANCIELSQPADGCAQCKRVGCLHRGQKFEAGHTFQMEPCQVCHCPNEGGPLMCYAVPNCDLLRIQKPLPVTPIEEDALERRYNNPDLYDQEGNVDHLPPAYRLLPNANLPLVEEDSHQAEGEDDYDYLATDTPPHDALPTEPSAVLLSNSESPTLLDRFDEVIKQELRQRFGSHEVEPSREELTDRPETMNETTPRLPERTWEKQTHQEGTDLMEERNKEEALVLPIESRKTTVFREKDVEQKNTHMRDEKEMDSSIIKKDVLSEAGHEHKTIHRGQLHEMDSNLTQIDESSEAGHEHKTIHRGQLHEMDSNLTKKDESSEAGHEHKTIHRGQLNEMDSNLTKKDESSEVGHEHKTIHRGQLNEMDSNLTKKDEADRENKSRHHVHITESSTVLGRDERLSVDLSTLPKTPEHNTSPMGNLIPTSDPLMKMKMNEDESLTEPLPPPLHQAEEDDGQDAFSFFANHGEDIPASSLVEECCKAGQKWASDNHHCHSMVFIRQDSQSICRTVQEQCCSADLKESSCLAGINAAKAGVPCRVDGDECRSGPYKECCDCCTLGLQFRTGDHDCTVHQHLTYSCGNIFLSCCEEDYTPPQPALRRKQRPEPTTLPDRVSDSKFPNEAFSIRDMEEAANSVEELEDVDECQLQGENLCHQRCINTWRSYQCACFPGYTLLQDGSFCVPENPTEDNRVTEEEVRTREPPQTAPSPTQNLALFNPCEGNGPCSHLCSVEGGQAYCSCFPGFALTADGHLCEDIDECGTGTSRCPRGDICINTAGSFQCVRRHEPCQEGFIRNVNRECVDVNECITHAHSCQTNEKCINTVGSFVCQRQVTCAAGYQPRDGACEDINECTLGIHNCGGSLECLNTEGSFSCQPRQTCFTGFSQDMHGNCVDVDECGSLEEPCSSGFNCINTVGSYTCQRKVILCNQGYQASADGSRCTDVDECQTGTHRCGEAQICQNLPGTYRCNCQTGYQPDLIRGMCVDVNECWRYPGRLCAHTCENTPGSYRCTCTAGFSLANDGKNCEDVNECNNNPCSQECANIYGSYQCYCRQGFYLKEDGHTCEDIDECSQSVGHLCAFKCVNVPGSYQCACPPHGYSMSPNGRACRDIDECAIGAHNCSATETCYNIQGTFRCLSFTCPPNYRRVSDMRCERVNCPNFLECQNSPLRITYYQLSFQTNIIIPALIFRIGPSPAYSGDSIIIRITRGNEENYFSTRKLNAFTGAVYLQRQLREPRDFLIDVEMKLFRQGTFTTFLARIYVFITAPSL